MTKPGQGKIRPTPHTEPRSSTRATLTWGAFGLALLAAVFFYLRHRAHHDPKIPYLPSHAGAEWIVFSRAAWQTPVRAFRQDASFERTFELTEVPASSPLIWRAFREAEVSLNGRAVEFDRAASWKQATQSDVAPLLQPGTNSLRVTVFNDRGPCALWLKLDLGTSTIATGTNWQVTLMGSTTGQAALATQPQPRYEPGDGLSHPSPVVEVRRAAPWLAVVALAAGALAWWLLKQRFAMTASRVVILFACALGIGWLVIFANNFPLLTAGFGFDSEDHLAYVDYLAKNHRLPWAEDGREMHQPPLYYLVCAAPLAIGGLTTHDAWGLWLVRGTTMLLGFVHLGLLVAITLRVFGVADDKPDMNTSAKHPAALSVAARATLVAVLFAAALPLHLFIFQYPTNEAAAAVTSSAAIYLTLRMLTSERPSLWLSIGLGAALGAALLSKITTIILPPVVLTVLAAQLVFARQWRAAAWRQRVVVPLVVCLFVGGWHYARAYAHYGTPFVRHIELAGSAGASHWKDPGYRTARDYMRFGSVFDDPFFAGYNSVADALYSTCWGDGRCGGTALAAYRTPWNYRLMAVAYALALGPALLVLLGAVLTAWQLVRSRQPLDLLLSGTAGLMLLAILYESLRNPFLSVTKAWYGLPAIATALVFLARGYMALAARSRTVEIVVVAWLATWTTASLGAFWIRTHASETSEMIGLSLVDRSDLREVFGYVAAAVGLDDRNASARQYLGQLWMQTGHFDKAVPELNHSLELDPHLAVAHLDLAECYFKLGHAELVEQHARAAGGLCSSPEPWFFLGRSLAKQERYDDAASALREAIARWPFGSGPHRNLSRILLTQGHLDAAVRHATYAVSLSPDDLDSLANWSECLGIVGREREAAAALRRYLERPKPSPKIQAALAWLQATSSDPEVFDAVAALATAEAVNRDSPWQRSDFLRVLAAAQAAAGQFDQARTTIAQALDVAAKPDTPWFPPSALLEADRRLYQADQRRGLTPAPTAADR